MLVFILDLRFRSGFATEDELGGTRVLSVCSDLILWTRESLSKYTNAMPSVLTGDLEKERCLLTPSTPFLSSLTSILLFSCSEELACDLGIKSTGSTHVARSVMVTEANEAAERKENSNGKRVIQPLMPLYTSLP